MERTQITVWIFPQSVTALHRDFLQASCDRSTTTINAVCSETLPRVRQACGSSRLEAASRDRRQRVKMKVASLFPKVAISAFIFSLARMPCGVTASTGEVMEIKGEMVTELQKLSSPMLYIQFTHRAQGRRDVHGILNLDSSWWKCSGRICCTAVLLYCASLVARVAWPDLHRYNSQNTRVLSSRCMWCHQTIATSYSSPRSAISGA